MASRLIGGPSVGMSNSMRLVLPISVAVWDMMLMYLMLSSLFSLSLALSGMSASGIDLGELLVSGSNCRLVLLGILGNNLAVLSCSLIQLAPGVLHIFPLMLVWLLANF